MNSLSFSVCSTWISIGFLLSGFSLSGEALAQHRSRGLDEITEFAELVIYGTVVDKSTYREPILMDTFSSDGKGNRIKNIETWDEILTGYEIEVYDVYKGKYEKSTIQLTVVGGTVGDETLDTSESFSLTVGNAYYFFLNYEQRNDKWWASWHQKGVFEEVKVKGEKYIRGINRRTVISRDGILVPNNKTDINKLGAEQFVSRIKADDHE